MSNSSQNITKLVLLTSWRSGSTFIRIWLNSLKTNRVHSEIFLGHYKAADGFKAYCEASVIRQTLFKIFSMHGIKRKKHNFVLNYIVNNFLNQFFNNPNFSDAWSDMDREGAWKQNQPRKNLKHEKIVGFQLMYSQLYEYRALQKWIESQDVSIIHLVRENSLKLLLSRIKASESHNWQFATNKAKEKTYITPETVIKRLDEITEETEKIANRFSQYKYIRISYENFINSYSEESEKIVNFLQLQDAEEMTFSKNLKKITPDSLSKAIENYDEIAQILKSTPYQKFLS